MQSNSKLNTYEKQDLKTFKQENPAVVFATCERVTVCLKPTGRNMAEFSVSVASHNEKKIRPKVGQYHAAMRLENGAGQPVNAAYCEPEDIAQKIADTLAGVYW